jgi:ubiquinone biosynthesis protein
MLIGLGQIRFVHTTRDRIGGECTVFDQHVLVRYGSKRHGKYRRRLPMNSSAPPLPDLDALLLRSPWAAAEPGLVQAATGWRRSLPVLRRALEQEAAALARPRLWTDTVGSLATTGFKVLAAGAPDAPVALLSAAASAVGLPISPPSSSYGIVNRAERLVRTGGPAYIKLGQFIASARGLLPEGWVEAFEWCRDEAPPLAPGVAEDVLRAELGDRHHLVRDFDDQPLGAASIAQVHRARLSDGRDVVVKIRRPGLRRQFRTDIETMALVAAVAERFSASARFANLTGFVELFAELSLAELDFRLEALNLVELGVAFGDAGIDYCSIPRPVPELVREGVLVMEHVSGVAYDKARTKYGSRLQGERLLTLAIQGVLETTLMYGLFHGDLHAGNVLIDGGDRFALVDFGICGRIDAEQRAALVRFLLAFAEMDARAQLIALEPFGAIPPDADIDALAAPLQAEIDQIDPRAGHQLTFDQLGDVVGRVLRILSASGFRAPKDLVLFFKNLLYLSSFTASVAPDSDLLAQIEPVMRHLTAKYPDAVSEIVFGSRPPAPPRGAAWRDRRKEASDALARRLVTWGARRWPGLAVAWATQERGGGLGRGQPSP